MQLKPWITLGLIAMIAAGKAQAGYGGELAVPLIAAGGTCVFGLTTGGLMLSTNSEKPSPETMILVGSTLAIALLGATTESFNKELIQVLKTDHDTWLAGGEMTPFLQNVYREVQARSRDFDLKDGKAAGNRIDERKMTEAIDRLVARTESNTP
ncbi:MAG: hypothetical protein RL318_2195 [Fibrobacterota bacterium]|jgi:hypothetical protein